MNVQALFGMGALSFLVAPQQVPVPPVSVPAPPPPPKTLPPVPPPPSQTLLTWMPGEVRCAGGVVNGTPMRRPLNELRWGSMPPMMPVAFRFEIDATGRPLSIERDPEQQYVSADLTPALAASRFPAGAPQKGCAVTYSPNLQPLDSAPVADLISYTMSPMNGRLPKAGWDRIRAMGNCGDFPRPQPLTRVLPDFNALAGTPGVQDWSMVEYDTDRAGKPVNVRATNGTGNRALDAASVKAMEESRFTEGARTGCAYPYWRAPINLAPPPMPSEDSFRPPDATCPAGREWVKTPALTFPEPYRRRKIEGWAIVRYDVAPWGEIGNVTVLASQPTADFGTQAIQVMRSARLATRPQGATGCIDRVKFVMGPESMPPSDPDAAATLY